MRPAALPLVCSVAALLALAAGAAADLYWLERAQNELLRQRQELAEIEARSLRGQLEAERILSAKRLEDAARELDAAERKIQDLERRLEAGPKVPGR